MRHECACDREALLEEIAWLRSEVAMLRDVQRQEIVMRHFGLRSPVLTEMLLTLYDAGGRVVPAWRLDAIPPTPGNVRVWICHLRRAMRFEALRVVKEIGWLMTPVGLDMVREALEPETALAPETEPRTPRMAQGDPLDKFKLDSYLPCERLGGVAGC